MLELGCGQKRRIPGAVTIDREPLPQVDIVADLAQGIPMDDGEVDEIYSFHFLEHIADFDFMFREMYRVLKPGGRLIGTVPHFSNPYFYSDPTHKTFFGLYTFCYYAAGQHYFHRQVPAFYSRDYFRVVNLKLIFKSPFVGRWPFKKLVQILANLCTWTKEFYEENLAGLIPVYEIYFELEKKTVP
ncbi:MAG: methyltransferase domain-containing protein [Victivallaceae bacterium]|nr:methyltransferase domain-containing protein [Victivallaceae bacterium]